MEEIEKDFAAFAKNRAKDLAPGLDWEKPKSMRVASGRTRVPGQTEVPPPPFSQEHNEAESVKPADSASTTNYWVLLQNARRLIENKNWTAAKAPLQKLVDLYPVKQT